MINGNNLKKRHVKKYIYLYCEAQGKGRAKGRLRKSIVDCQLSIVVSDVSSVASRISHLAVSFVSGSRVSDKPATSNFKI